MLVCTKCGVGNPVGHKFCRECGEPLQHASAVPPEQETVQEPQEGIDVAVGKLLYETFQLYETGKLDEALDSCKEALRLNPESTSAHSLFGMIYEKKSEMAELVHARDDARDFLLAAIRQYDRVLEINPHSIADAEKLNELKDRLRHWDGVSEPVSFQLALQNSLEVIRQIPKPLAAGGGAAFLALVVLLLVWSRGPQPAGISSPAPPMPQVTSAPQEQPTPQPAPNYQYYPQPQPGPVADLPFVSTEPVQDETQQAEAPRAAEQSPAGPVAPPEPQRTIPPPIRLLPGPLPGISSGGGETPPAASEAKPEPPPPAKKLKGSDLQFQAMELARQKKTQEALTTFRKAIDAFEQQKKTGEDVESANAGIRTCKHYIEMLESH